jgi:hypothetical protein
MRPVLTRFVADALSAVDYRFVLTLNPGETDLVPRQSPTVRAQEESSTIVAGRAWMSGVLTNRTTLKGSLAHQDGVETLTLPLEGWHSFSTTAAGYSFRFEVEAPTQAGGPLRLSWPPGYRLQRATRLFPPNWTNDAITSPLVIHVLQPAEYFRAIRHDPAPGSGAAIASLQSWEFQRCPVQEGKELSCCERESSKVEVAKPVHNP